MEFFKFENLRLAIGSDHAGYKLKSQLVGYLEEINIRSEDFGAYSDKSTDYPDYAIKVARSVANCSFPAGILICGTGLGMSIVANKIKGIRAALCNSVFFAEISRRHNDANILCLGGRVITFDEAKNILNIWLSTPFEGGRHATRINKIKELT